MYKQWLKVWENEQLIPEVFRRKRPSGRIFGTFVYKLLFFVYLKFNFRHFFFGTSFILCTKSGNPTVIYYQNLIWSQVCTYTGFPSGSAIKNLTATKKTQETWVQSLDWKDPLEEGMATFSSILAWRIPRTEEPGRLQSMGSQESNTTEVTEHPFIHRHIHMFTHTNTHTHT